VNEIGGTANLAVIEFSDYAQIILDGQAKMYRLTQARVTALNTYLDTQLFSDTLSPSSSYTYEPGYGGCTNWAGE
jgi:hypothetical protein